MKTGLSALLSSVVALLTIEAAEATPVVAKVAVSAPVTITDSVDTWVLDNGIVAMTINKKNSNPPSIIYKGINIVRHVEGWEQTPSGQVTPSVTIDPAKNGGQRGEVAVKGVNGKMDIEVRYTLERGVSGFYTYAQYSHPASYPAAGFGESRFILEMNPTFDWLSVDADRNMLMCKDSDIASGVVIHAKEQHILNTGIYKNSVEHKYSYCGVMYKLPAYGWSSTRDRIGIYFINPSTEYIGGGSAKLDLVCHMGSTILDYWTSGHYAGGANCNIPVGENWNKVVGPIFVYLNSLSSAETPTQADLAAFAATEGNPTVPPAWKDNGTALWQDAMAKAREIKAEWPFGWVSGVDYLKKDQRGNVTGRLVLDDPQAASTKLPHLTVGLAHPEYQGNNSEFVRRSGNGNTIKWPHDGNYYQFWSDGNEDGTFTIANVRPGSYVLYAFADGVLGEFARANIRVDAGKNLDLGNINWKPVRYGRQLWEIGYPDRTGGKFFKGDGANYWRWGWDFRYALLFPNDLTYAVGKSNYHKDWFFEEVPHAESRDWINPEAKDPANQPFGWVKSLPTGSPDPWRIWGKGRATTWTIKFNLAKPVLGKATLRVALAGADGGGGLDVAVNGREAGTIHPVATNALRYNTDTGVWQEQTLPFDASLLKWGENELKLTVPAGDLTTGVVYDYLRLELDENPKAALN